jgi:hypothetical protein
MTPRIRSGDLCTVAPLGAHELEPGDIVLCKVRGQQYLHLVSAVRGEEIQISNNHGHVNGWCRRTSVYGLLVAVQS